MDTEKVSHKLNIVRIKERRLQRLELIEAAKGLNSEPEILNEIDNLRNEVKDLLDEIYLLRRGNAIIKEKPDDANQIIELINSLQELRIEVKILKQQLDSSHEKKKRKYKQNKGKKRK